MKNIQIGSVAYFGDQEVKIIEIQELEHARISSLSDGSVRVVKLAELSTALKSNRTNVRAFADVALRDWQTAVERGRLIKPLLNKRNSNSEDIELVANKLGKSVRTVYRWLKNLREYQSLTALLRNPRSDKSSYRLSEEVEQLIENCINSDYLAEERISVQELYRRVRDECEEKNLKVPHRNTVASRVACRPHREVVKARMGRNEHRKLLPVPGKFPGADFPNAVVQVDHTPVDIILVDSKFRQPIGRPNLTLVIDVCTKMVNGYYLSLDPVGALSAGLCIAHAVARKDLWLAKRNIEATWPIHGKMEKIHVDNAAEFQGEMIKRACDENDIILEWRPKGSPNYGPHVERAFRTFMGRVQTLPGTTFSSVARKLDYDSEGRACMTIDEFDRWFAIFLSADYHNSPHKGNDGVAPITMYYRYVHGTDTQLGLGFPAVVNDEEKFCFDFMPFKKRTIQRAGVEINHLFYFAPVLRSYVGLKDPVTQKAMQYMFVYDPRDVSVIYFYDSARRVYHPVHRSDQSMEPMSLWELRAVKKHIRETPGVKVDSRTISEGRRQMLAIEEEALERTSIAKKQLAQHKKDRRTAERRSKWAGVHDKAGEAITPEPQKDIDAFFDDDDDITPFDEIKV
jgi:putative transposase